MVNKKPNIIFLTIDALRPKNLGCYGYKRDTSPNIDSYARQGVLFKNFFTVSNGTHKSIFSILSGRHLLLQDFANYPTQREMKSFFETGGIFLSEILQKQGYKTHFLQKLFGWQKMGFDYYFKQNSLEESKKWGFIRSLKKTPLIYKSFKYLFHNTYLIPRRLENRIRSNKSAEKATNKAIEIIKQNKENNFFLWLHYTNPHGPYVFPYRFDRKFIPDKESKKLFETLNSSRHNKKATDVNKNYYKFDETFESLMAKYDTAIFYVDCLIGKIIDTLEEENLLKDTIVFLFADHGIDWCEHVLCLTNVGVYDTNFKIPLIIFGGGIPKNKKIEALTQSKDLAPTILDLIGVKYDPTMFDGKSLFSLLFGKDEEIRESIILEGNATGIKKRAIRTKKYKYMESPDKKNSVHTVCNTTHGPIVGLYDLEKDPDETVNVAEKNKKITKEMKSKLDKTLRDLKTLNEKRKIQIIIKKNKLV
jgi:arylsulfatase A-like enzyme